VSAGWPGGRTGEGPVGRVSGRAAGWHTQPGGRVIRPAGRPGGIPGRAAGWYSRPGLTVMCGTQSVHGAAARAVCTGFLRGKIPNELV